MRVTVTTHRWAVDQTLDVRLIPQGSVATLTAVPGAERYAGHTPYADFVIEVPAGVLIEVTSSSGEVTLESLARSASTS